jgi:hypothetical protein
LEIFSGREGLQKEEVLCSLFQAIEMSYVENIWCKGWWNEKRGEVK